MLDNDDAFLKTCNSHLTTSGEQFELEIRSIDKHLRLVALAPFYKQINIFKRLCDLLTEI